MSSLATDHSQFGLFSVQPRFDRGEVLAEVASTVAVLQIRHLRTFYEKALSPSNTDDE